MPTKAGRILTFDRCKVVTFVLVSGALLAGCASQIGPTISLAVSTQQGPAGKQFKASFPHQPRAHYYLNSGVKERQYGVGVQSSTIYSSGTNGPTEMDVWIVSLTNSVPARRVDPFMRSYLSNRGGRIIKWFGLPAAEEFTPGCDPSGQCTGTVGNLVVLDGTTLYFVFTHEYTRTAALEEVRSFRLVK